MGAWDVGNQTLSFESNFTIYKLIEFKSYKIYFLLKSIDNLKKKGKIK